MAQETFDGLASSTNSGTKTGGILDWAGDLSSFVDDDIPLIVVGNKTDLEREVSKVTLRYQIVF